MKKFFFPVLTVAIVLTSCQSKENPAQAEKPMETPSETTETAAEIAGLPLQIRYIRLDSLVENYEYHQELKAQFEQEAKKLERQLESRAKAFEENYKLLEQRAPSMSPAELQKHQADLQAKQQQLIQYRDQLGNDLLEREAALNKSLREDLDTVLTKVRGELNLDYIFSYEPGGQVLSMDEKHNITPLVVERLNKNHEARKNEE